MRKETLTYTDWDGTEKTSEFFFNLTKVEYTKFIASNVPLADDGEPEDLKAYVERLAANKDYGELIRLVEAFIQAAYGERHGVNFVKIDKFGNPLGAAFATTDAYSVLFEKLANDDAFLQQFIAGITPYKNVQKA